jgi:predicted ribosome quality control (RQC) complex YloA/Tae2 family protein
MQSVKAKLLRVHRIEREEKRLKDWTQALEYAENAEILKIKGELLHTHTSTIEKGSERVTLPNYYDPDLTPLEIELDTTLSPQENAEAYFRRHRKAKASVPVLKRRIEEAKDQVQLWQATLEQLGEMEENSLMELMQTLSAGEPSQEESREMGEGSKRPAPGVRRTLSSDGYEIWYGENRKANDLLTSRLASPNDLWLHVRASASSHVVIRTGKRPDAVPQRTLQEAARIAAAHSEAKHSSVIPVDVTLKKYVRKPRGAEPGTVLYTHERTLHVEKDKNP